MMFGLILTSFFVATITSALTVSALTGWVLTINMISSNVAHGACREINGVNDLPGRRIGIVKDSTSGEYVVRL